ncbi:hypothetical protein Tco_1353350 [Tanacetum coccineum]
MILSGVDNRSHYVGHGWFDSWKSEWELYMKDWSDRRTILESVGNGPLIWLLLKGMEVAKDLWERVQLLMQGTSLTKQERGLVKDLHTTNFDQLHAYLEQHELHANEVRLLRKRNQDPLAFMANQQMTPPHFNTYQSSYNNPQLQQQFSPPQYGSIHPN